MAHIADCMKTTNMTVGINNYIARETSPSPKARPEDTTPLREPGTSWISTATPPEGQKYTLYPVSSGRVTPSSGRSTPDLDRILTIRSNSALGMRTSSSLSDLHQPLASASGRLKTKDGRGRRKISVPELGPMTTVQEAAMDSPTIPGRPPLHERSISAPGDSWRQCPFGDAMVSCITGPVLQPLGSAQPGTENIAPAPALTPWPSLPPAVTENSAKRKSTSPRLLAPLVIPSKERAKAGRSPLNNLLDDDVPPEVPPKSPKKSSPKPKGLGLMTFMNGSAATLPNPAIPVSTTEGRTSPKLIATQTRSESPSPQQSQTQATVEAGTSILDRGRPARRAESRARVLDNIARQNRKSPEEAQKAFERLPQGYRAEDAIIKLPNSQIEALQKQALGQAERFEVLGAKDVESLSRELRALDERCEYLRKTFNSLRSGRRSLHNRMITYLRAPRLAQFSRESILKQEEALAELDLSIDDWVDKLAQAENRRTRIRQKLLEHVAAALTLKPESKAQGEQTPPRSPEKVESPSHIERRDVESIKIYADSNVYALLQDVEQEIGRMVDFCACDEIRSA